MKVLMIPHASNFAGSKDESGIRRVVEAYFHYLPQFGVEFVARNATDWDLKVTHAGMGDPDADVAMTHGLYWTADYQAPAWEYATNAKVIAAVRHAREVTVPSPWVAEAFARDMRFSPHVVPHGIEWDDWQHEYENEGYVLWNKNRTADVCSPEDMGRLAQAFPDQLFVSTFSPKVAAANVTEIGVVPHKRMQRIVQGAGVYLSTTKETFGIGVLEAMASGVPVLGYAYGGNVDLVQHGVNGYLAAPGDVDGLIEGLHYCRQYRDALGDNGRELARQWTWEAACERASEVFRLALAPEPATAAIVIPSYNYAGKVAEAVKSACAQTYPDLIDVIVVDDGSTDDTKAVVAALAESDRRVRYVHQPNAGVANARNRGISETSATYITCLDADDAIDPTFLETLIPHLEADRSLGLVYSGLRVVAGDGRRYQGRWPHACNFDAQLKGDNQVPTCCVFRRKAWVRLGGYKQRYAPLGQGTEDAEFWLRIGAYGWGIQQVTPKPLFLYTWGGRTTNNPDYEEVDWTALHPWTKDGQHPFASIATPREHSHPVRQYDEPTVSVVIPVGPGHGRDVTQALDSLESQIYRRWEVIVVDDTGQSETRPLRDAYPYVRWSYTKGELGAGVARNFGAGMARAPLLLFLDADDWLYPNAIRAMLAAWQEEQAIVYTDYVGRAIIDEELANELEDARRLLSWHAESGEAVIRYHSADYDCEVAQRQPEYTGDPNMPFFHWCLVTALVPTAWHQQIGGFDEALETWEDLDYHWRMARAGRCYVRIAEPLAVYNFHTGHRREASRSRHAVQKVVEYIRAKYEGGSIVPCSGCGKKVANAPVFAPLGQSGPSARRVAMERAQDDDFVLVKYLSPNRGNHPVVGHVTQQPYGYRKGGDQFLVHKTDVWLGGDPNLQRIGPFEPIPREIKVAVQTPAQKKKGVAPPQRIAPASPSQPSPARVLEPLPEPEEPALDEPLDLQTIPGLTAQIAAQLEAQGVTTQAGILELGRTGLQALRGCGEVRADMIVGFLEEPEVA